MAVNRYYSSSAGAMTLSTSVTAGDTTLVVSATTGLPTSYPYTLVVDVGAATEEIVKVTAAAGTSLTVVRGQDGSTGQSHSTGAAVRHMASAQDFREPQEHIAASAGIHGITGNVVGHTDTQTLTNKTVTGGTVNPTTLQKGGVNVPTISETATITNKDMSSGTNTFPSSLATDAEVTSAVSTHAALTTGTHGVGAGAVVGTGLTQTLTGKTIDGGSNTLQNIPQSAVTGLTAALADGGWVNLSTAGFSGTVIDTVACRLLDGVVYMRGNVNSFTSGSFQTLCTLPVGSRPAVASNFGVSSNTTNTMVIAIATTGVVTVWCSASTSAYTGLAGVNFPVG